MTAALLTEDETRQLGDVTRQARLVACSRCGADPLEECTPTGLHLERFIRAWSVQSLSDAELTLVLQAMVVFTAESQVTPEVLEEARAA